MSVFVQTVLFLAYKAAEASAGWWLLGNFGLRHEMPVNLLYIGFSVIQFLFVLYSAVSRGKNRNGNPAAVRSAPSVTALIGFSILVGIAFALRVQENGIAVLLMILSVFTPILSLYAFLMQTASGFQLRQATTEVPAPGWLSGLILALIGFGVPAALGIYLYYHFVLFPQNPLPSKVPNELLYGIPVLAANIAVQGLIVIARLFRRSFMIRRLGGQIRSLSMNTEVSAIRDEDAEESGYVRSELRHLLKRLTEQRASSILLNGYVSGKIRADFANSDLNLAGANRNATVLAIRYPLPLELRSPDQVIRLGNAIAGIVGEFASEYDGYPVFDVSRAIIAFGVPTYFEHQKYNALECAQKIVSEIDNYAAAESLTLSCRIGVFSGNVVAGAVAQRGRNEREIVLTGEAVEMAYYLAEACEPAKCRIMACSNTVEKLRTKFYIDRSFHLKLRGDETALVHEVRP
jgi:hypothetical protein